MLDRVFVLTFLLLGSPAMASPFRGVVFDPEADLMYVATPDGGVDALRMRDGTTAWSTSEASEPLQIVGNSMAAHADPVPGDPPNLRIAFFDRTTGKRTCLLLPEVPALPHAKVADVRTGHLRVSLDEPGDGLFLSWSSQTFDPVESLAGSEAPEPRTPPKGHQLVSGLIQVDLAACQSRSVDISEVPAPKPSVPPPGWNGLQVDEPASKPFYVDGVITALELRPLRDGVQYRLKRWRRADRKPIGVIPLISLKQRAHTGLSIDRRFVSFSEWLSRPPPHGTLRWHVFSAADGRRVTTTESPCMASSFAVHEGQIITFERERVCVLDRKSGREQYRRPVRVLEWIPPSKH
jgi:hypothetical protein